VSFAQRIYWGLPYFAKCWAASWNTRRLDRERFGPEFEFALTGIRERDGWDTGQLEEFQDKSLRDLVSHAAAHIPYYRESFARVGLKPGTFLGLADLRRLPILEKADARIRCRDLVDERLDPGRLIVEHTSGTTGTPVCLYRDRADTAAAYAYNEARWHAVAGMRRGRNRSVSIGGHLVVQPDRPRPPFWVSNRRWQQFYMSSYHLSPQNLGAYVEALREFGGEYIEGYPSSVCAIAQHIVENRLDTVPFGACFTTAETLSDSQREVIRRAFGCATFNQYGCGEMAVFAADCPRGGLHLSPDYGIMEVLDESGEPAPLGQPGTLVCTGLANRSQPFIRYRLGDIGALSERACSCGSALPLLASIEGRTDAVLKTRNGRLVGRLDPVYKGVEGVNEAQIVQEDWDRFLIRVVPGRDYRPSDGERIRSNLMERLGSECNVRVEKVDAIERTSAGKFRAVVPMELISIR